MSPGLNEHFDSTDSPSVDVSSANTEPMSEPAALALIECSVLLNLTNVQQRGGSLARPAFQPVKHVSDWYGCNVIFDADLEFRRWYDGKSNPKEVGESLKCSVLERDYNIHIIFSRPAGSKEIIFEEPIRKDVSYEILRNYVFSATKKRTYTKAET